MAGAVGTLEGFGGGASAAGGHLPTDGDLSNVERIDECLRLQVAWVREVTQWPLKRRLVSEQLGASERATRLCRVRRRGCRRDGPESGTQKRAGPDRAPGTPALNGRPRTERGRAGQGGWRRAGKRGGRFTPEGAVRGVLGSHVLPSTAGGVAREDSFVGAPWEQRLNQGEPAAAGLAGLMTRPLR